jgi:hypothetical protein
MISNGYERYRTASDLEKGDEKEKEFSHLNIPAFYSPISSFLSTKKQDCGPEGLQKPFNPSGPAGQDYFLMSGR